MNEGDLVSICSDELLAHLSEVKVNATYWMGKVIKVEDNGDCLVYFNHPDYNMTMTVHEDKLTRLCPICQREMEDARHVSVECFYAVDEVVPQMKQYKVFSEVPETSSIWGITRRYPAGTKDKHVDGGTVIENGIPTPSINTVQEPIDPIRVMEQTVYSHDCCKKCRFDFMLLLKRWVNSEFVSDDGSRREDATIPVRVGGAIKYMTTEEFEEYSTCRNPDGYMGKTVNGNPSCRDSHSGKKILPHKKGKRGKRP